MLIEVLTNESGKHDKGKKRKVYESCGVKEYFIVDPQTKEVNGCNLQNKTFTEEKLIGQIVSKLLKKTFRSKTTAYQFFYILFQSILNSGIT